MGRLKSLVAKVPKSVGGAAQGARAAITGASAAASAAATAAVTSGAVTLALMVTGGAAAIGAAVIGGKAWYASLMHGTFTCGPIDGEGSKTYLFNFTNAESSWYWKTTDQRAFTSTDIGDLLNIRTREECLLGNARTTASGSPKDCSTSEFISGCDDRTADLLTKHVRATGEKMIADLGTAGGSELKGAAEAKSQE
jgi:hypothetical protein